ncbi:diguanylate cyclase [Agrobacterium larrymoorei]|uniref:diguanylate cyclase domain-containing protein n=1 Tax=Agrobacterium larrymoorei TaxID=160699 RepID=UPI0015730E16|nr:diguanylate cyclase [Agrobacterium larrymoorei]NTJ41581.1 diguanylate cyclase [Agrobacterium larrymoorei]
MREEKGAQSFTAQASVMHFLQEAVVDERLAYLFDNIPEMVFLKDADGNYNYMNAAALACLGHEPGFLGGRKMTIYDMAPPEVARRLDEMDRRIMSSGVGLYNAEERVAGKDGQVRWYSGTRIPVRNAEGQVIGIAGISREITAAKRQETLLRCHADLLEMVVKGLPLPTILKSVVSTIEGLLDNVTGAVMLLDEKQECLRNIAAPGLPDAYLALIDGLKIGPKAGSCGTAAWRREAVYVRDTFQDELWADFVELAMRYGLRSCWSTPIMGNGGVLLGTFALYSGTVRLPTTVESEIIDMATNIAGIAIDRCRAEERVHFMAHHDPLTGLSNRNLFWSQFGRAIHEAKRESRLVAITYLDLDNFKQINDVHGHAVGDEVLRAFAERVGSCIRASDIAVRLGGDEFAIIFSNPKHDQAGILRRLEAIRSKVGEPIALENGFISVTCSSGTAFYPDDGETPEVLLARADAAMYDAKKSGRNSVKVFEQQHGAGI